MIWNELKRFVEGHNAFLVTSHRNMDGDCIGSQLAFRWYLESLGKLVLICNPDPVPERFRFLKSADEIRVISQGDSFPGSALDPAGGAFALAVLDASNLYRLGWDPLAAGALPTVNIDHHRDNGQFGEVNVVDSSASATGEILYRFFTDTKTEFPSHVAEALYTAIMTDTGGFRFPNTTPRVLAICADLAERGANPAKLYERAYATHSPGGLLLQSRVWSTLKYYLDGRVCAMELPTAFIAESGAKPGDSEGLVDNTITATGVEVGFLAKHSDTQTHFSLRSRGRVDVGKIAQDIPQGGGHHGAAGCTIHAPYPAALEQLLALIAREIT